MDNSIFENLSIIADAGVSVLDMSGNTRFKSKKYLSCECFLRKLREILDSSKTDQAALLYGCYQSRRFGGRYVFFTPSGMAYCASPITDSKNTLMTGVLAGPFLLTDYDEYIEIDIISHHAVSPADASDIRRELDTIPIKTPAEVCALSEQLFICASYKYNAAHSESIAVTQTDAISRVYSIDKEDDLLSAISIGDIRTASALLNDILGQILFHSSGDLEVLRSRVVELTVLLSRAALKGGANIDAIFGLNFNYLREIDALSSPEDIILWLHGVTRRFVGHVFDYANAKHVDVIYKATSFIRQHFSQKITLQDVSEHVFLNPTYFSKVFKEEVGLTPGAYITAVRIEESKKLLRDMSVNIADIPELIGFESQSYFTQVFKKTEGCTPGRYRQKNMERSSMSKGRNE